MSTQKERLGHAEVLRILGGQSDSQDALILEYLRGVAESYTVDEAFSVIALVNTPDVFD